MDWGKIQKFLQRNALLFLVAGAALCGWWPRCLMASVLHLPCLTCGMTRSFGALLRFDWQTSLFYHPLTVPFGITILVAVNRDFLGISERVMRVWFGLLGGALLLFWCYRLSLGSAEWSFLV